MGKTAIALSLVLSGAGDGPTLVVAPAHLLQQWRAEVTKFCGDALPVITGLAAFEATPAASLRRGRHLVLVDVQEVLGGTRIDYRWSMRHDPKMQEARLAAKFCVQSPRGPCSYEGAVYTDRLHMPEVPWRRVVYDEIQDLVHDAGAPHANMLSYMPTWDWQVHDVGGTSKEPPGKNLLQLSRTARNVWLLSATPFPHGNASVRRHAARRCSRLLQLPANWRPN